MKVAVVGIGRVGLPLATVSSKYHETVGIDLDEGIVQKVNEKAPFKEPQLNEYLNEYSLRAFTDFKRVEDRDLVIICVGSQSPGEGYSTRNLLPALDKVVMHLKPEDQVLNIVSTLPLGAWQNELARYFQGNPTLGVCYNPTMIALGNAVNDFERPNYILIGESDEDAGQRVESFWRAIVGKNTPTIHSSIRNIILAKYALNTALVLKISLMNLLTELCEKCDGDVDVISEILKAEPRVAGPKMFKGGLGYGGTCFPVDVEALYHECKQLSIPTDFPAAIGGLNSWQVDRTLDLIKSFGKLKVGILGVTFKPNTPVVAASQALQIAERLASQNYPVMIYDPQGMPSAREHLRDRVMYADTKEEAISFGDIIFLGVEWPEFSELESGNFRKDQLVVDPWRILRNKSLLCKYYGFGLAEK